MPSMFLCVYNDGLEPARDVVSIGTRGRTKHSAFDGLMSTRGESFVFVPVSSFIDRLG